MNVFLIISGVLAYLTVGFFTAVWLERADLAEKAELGTEIRSRYRDRDTDEKYGFLAGLMIAWPLVGVVLGLTLICEAIGELFDSFTEKPETP